MRRGRIKIVSRSAGQTQRVEADCRVEEADGLSVFYTDDGDDCKICVNGKNVTYEREGSVRLKLIFREGGNTTCYIGMDGGYGHIVCSTQKLSVFRGEGGVSIRINYALEQNSATQLSAMILF